MRRTVLVMLGLALLIAVGTVRAQMQVLAVLQTQQEVYVDTITLEETPYPIAGFGGLGVTDTTDLGTFDDFPRFALVSFTVDGDRMLPVQIDRLEPDVWYPLENFDQPAQLMFLRAEPGVEELVPARPVRGLVVSPNPFSATTRLRWELTAPAAARADLFDRSGRLVRTLLDARLDTGNHSLTWDGCDDRGDRLDPGVYLLRLRAGQDSQLLKVVLAG